MNILIVLSQLEVTGAEVYGVTLADELINRGNNVIVLSDTLTKITNAKYIKMEFNKRGLVERINQIRGILKIIKEHDIQVAHANSRASSWSTQIACIIARIPLITTVHGKQPVHISRKIFKAFGDQTIVVCENIKEQIVKELGVEEKKIISLRNPIDIEKYPFIHNEKTTKDTKIISIIGRLTGPKGIVAYNLLKILNRIEKIEIRVIGGKNIPKEFEIYLKNKNIKFLGYVENIQDLVQETDIIIGAGRVAIEGVLSGKPVIAIGEGKYIGLLKKENILESLKSNFGDIVVENNASFNWNLIEKDLKKSLLEKNDDLEELNLKVRKEFELKNIVDEIEKIYASSYVKKKKKEIPVIMYHRVVKTEENVGVHGTYITLDKFEKHMKYLYDQGYKTITFEDLKKKNYRDRFNKNEKNIMITFDDGYDDNYTLAFPVLKKYNFKAIIYLMSHLNFNKWDVENVENPENRFELMNDDMIKEMGKYGIEFGGHTMTHKKLSEISLDESKNEIINSKKVLEKKLEKKLLSFAYPYGKLNEEVKKIVKESGYLFAVATDSGPINFSEDFYQIRRIAIFPSNGLFSFKRKVKGNYNFIKLNREKKNIKKIEKKRI